MICLGILPLMSQERLNPMLPEEPSGATGTMAMLVSVASVYLGRGEPGAPAGIRPKLWPSLLHPVQITAQCSKLQITAQVHFVHETQTACGTKTAKRTQETGSTDCKKIHFSHALLAL